MVAFVGFFVLFFVLFLLRKVSISSPPLQIEPADNCSGVHPFSVDIRDD